MFFDCALIHLSPKSKSFNITHVAQYAHDNTYVLTRYPSYGLGFKVALGYNFRICSSEKFKWKLPFLLNYRWIREKNTQEGYYYSGATQMYFNGKSQTTAKLNIISPAIGLNFVVRNGPKSELMVEGLLSGNINIVTSFTNKEWPSNPNFPTKVQNVSYNDFTFYFSAEIKIAKLFKVHNFLLGPYLSYNFNRYYDPHYKISKVDYKFRNPLYNITFYYHFIETGIKIKI